MGFKVAVLVSAFAVAVGRIFITPRLVNIPTAEGSYEALAHMLVGFLILVSLYDRQGTIGPSKLLGRVGWALALWEAGWFLAQKLHLGV